MSGHSQYSNIKHKKEAQDGRRAKLFTKCARAVEVAARSGPDPEMNPKLRTAVIAARKINMPKNKIEQSIAKGSGANANDSYNEVRYECKHGSSGVSFIVTALTDNRNRTASDLKSLLTKRGAVLVVPGSLAYMFDNVGKIQYQREKCDCSGLMEKAIELNAIDVEEDNEFAYLYFPISEFDKATEKLEQQFGPSSSDSRLTWKAKEIISPPEQELQKFFDLVDALEDLDDIQNVDANCPMRCD